MWGGAEASSSEFWIMGTERWEGPADQHKQVLFRDWKLFRCKAFRWRWRFRQTCVISLPNQNLICCDTLPEWHFITTASQPLPKVIVALKNTVYFTLYYYYYFCLSLPPLSLLECKLIENRRFVYFAYWYPQLRTETYKLTGGSRMGLMKFDLHSRPRVMWADYLLTLLSNPLPLY